LDFSIESLSREAPKAFELRFFIPNGSSGSDDDMLKETSQFQNLVVLFPLQKMEMSKFWTVVENPNWGTNLERSSSQHKTVKLLDNGNLTLSNK
jgi:hypothetical protein